MLSYCAKLVEHVRKQHRKYSALLSTYWYKCGPAARNERAQPIVITNFIPMFPMQISPRKISNLPLIEHYFYPVSTAPIINPNKEN